MAPLAQSEIELILKGYAAGDVFGVAYEFSEYSGKVDPQVLREKAGWPYGGVSDDTFLSLLTIASFDPQSAAASRSKFLSSLHDSISRLRGLGPTTRAALGLPVNVEEQSQVGISNGALMRTSLLGLAFQVHEAKARRAFVRELAAATHGRESAIASAVIGSALFADARAHGCKHSPFEVAMQERDAIGADIELIDWQAPIGNGVSNESIETLNAVLWALKTSSSVASALSISCELGGDTDTVAALTTSLYIARNPDKAEFEALTWLGDIQWNEVQELLPMAVRLYQLYEDAKVAP